MADELNERLQLAASYAAQVATAAAECPDDPTGGPAVQDLIGEAIAAGVVGLPVQLDGFAEPVRLHEVFAPYRRDLAGEQTSRTAFLRDAHSRAVQGRRAEGRFRRWSW
jgi:hypothetical protein